MIVSKKPVIKTYKLINDPEGKADVTIRQATVEGVSLRASMFSETVREWDEEEPTKVRLHSRWNRYDQQRKEVFLTLSGATNIVDENGDDIFKFDTKGRLAMSETQFNEAWGYLPVGLAKEIHGYVLDMNPVWDPDASGE